MCTSYVILHAPQIICKKITFYFDVFGATLENVQMYQITTLQIEVHGQFFIDKCDRLTFDGQNVKPNTHFVPNYK